MKNNTMIGITAITAPAICIGYLVVYCPCNVERAGPSVILSIDVLTINGHMKSFHANFAVKITSDTIPAFVSGSNDPSKDLETVTTVQQRRFFQFLRQ